MEGTLSELQADQAFEPSQPIERAPPVQSRFLFVDIAAMRAKQLRRGAVPRIQHAAPDPVTGHRQEMPHKLERVAMEEVRQRLIGYDLPEPKPSGTEDTA